MELCSEGGALLRAFDLAECEAGPTGSEVRGVLRANLLEVLYESIPEASRVVSFGAAVESVEAEIGGSGSGTGTGVAVRLSDGRVVRGSALVGADGVGSAVARCLQLPALRYSGYQAYRGLAEMPGPTQAGSEPSCGPGPLPLDTIRQVWGAGVRAGMYPITPTRLYWFTCFNAEDRVGGPPGDAEARKRAALESVRGWSWGMEEAIRFTPADNIYWSRVSDRWTFGTFGRGLVTLAGDAAHPMTPNLGQGGAAALEDAVVLGRKLGALAKRAAAAGGGPPAEADLASCLRSYEEERSRRCLPLTVRSNLIGAALQLPQAPVCLARNLFVRTVFQPSHFLDHTAFDCGELA